MEQIAAAGRAAAMQVSTATTLTQLRAAEVQLQQARAPEVGAIPAVQPGAGPYDFSVFGPVNNGGRGGIQSTGEGYGGWGGGGYYGGGGGYADDSNQSGAGGGGSGFSSGATSVTSYTGSWSSAGNLSDPNRPSDAGDGGFDGAVVILIYGPAFTAPTIVGQPTSVAVSLGQAATFTVSASGYPLPTLQWRKDGIAIVGATNATLTVANTTAADVGIYTAVATNSVGSVTSNGAALALAILAQEIYNAPGLYSHTVPPNSSNAVIKVWGAGGAGVGGGAITGNVTVQPGDIIYVRVGAKGSNLNPGAKGGEGSAVKIVRSSSTIAIFVAGGGGNDADGPGGPGGGYAGVDGGNTSEAYGGGGATRTAAGAGGSGESPGAAGTGPYDFAIFGPVNNGGIGGIQSTGDGYGGGGGGGYYGGGGGGGGSIDGDPPDNRSGGGGGGSGFSSGATGVMTYTGSGSHSGNPSDPNRPLGAGEGDGDGAAVVMISIVDVPPTAPTALNYAERTATSVTLIWHAASDDFGVVGYNIYRGGALIASTGELAYTDTGLTANTLYTYTVKTIDTEGQLSAASNSLSVTTTQDFSADSDHDGIPDATENALVTNGSAAASADTTNLTQQNIHRPQQ